ncbi:MAG: FkbM family methyltransferase [Clostridiales bacterium]|jgi:FkbM family methyltransferase|nr:FkbM family methyltransferase [Clostridiales bacterium]
MITLPTVETIRKLAANTASAASAADTASAIISPYKKIIIYGAGNLGKRTLAILTNLGRQDDVAFFLDANPSGKTHYANIPIVLPDSDTVSDAIKEKALVIVAVMLNKSDYNSLEKRIKGYGYQNTLNAYALMTTSVQVSRVSEDMRYISDSADAVCDAFMLLSDEHSKSVFANILQAHTQHNYGDAIDANIPQYFDNSVPFANNYRRFVDCGAYNGDTLNELMSRTKCEWYIGFEPSLESYSLLVKNAMSYKIDTLCLPLAISDESGFVKFDDRSSGNSRIAEDGKSILQTVRLDDIIKNPDGLTIKMDIEGSEAAAICGAERLIKSGAPDLAICVYHYVSDLWEIPNMLHVLTPQYRFYLRNHYEYTFETVLYATVGGR